MPEATKKSQTAKKRYRVLTGLDYPPNRRAEAGDVVDDLPAGSIKWLLDDGLIEIASEKGEN